MWVRVVVRDDALPSCNKLPWMFVSSEVSRARMAIGMPLALPDAGERQSESVAGGLLLGQFDHAPRCTTCVAKHCKHSLFPSNGSPNGSFSFRLLTRLVGGGGRGERDPGSPMNPGDFKYGSVSPEIPFVLFSSPCGCSLTLPSSYLSCLSPLACF